MARESDLRSMAEDIADEAVKGYEKLFAPHLIAEMRRLLIMDMMCTDQGRATLRGCLGDRAMQKSGEAADEPEEPANEVKKGGSSAG